MSNKDDFMKKLLGAIKAAASGERDTGTIMVENKMDASIYCAEAVKAINDGKEIKIGMGVAGCGCHLMLLSIEGNEHDYGFGWEEASDFAEIARNSIGYQTNASDKATFEMMKLVTMSSVTASAIIARHALGQKHGDMIDEQLHAGGAMLAYLEKLKGVKAGEVKPDGMVEIRKGQPGYDGAVEFIKAAHEKVMPKARKYQKAIGMVTDAASVKPEHVEHMAKTLVEYNGATTGKGMGIMHVMKDGTISIDAKAEMYPDVIGTLFAHMTLAGEADVIAIAAFGDGMAKLVAEAEQKIVDDGNFDKAMNGPLGTLRNFAEGIKGGKPETMEKFNELCISSTSNGNIIPIDPKDLANEKSVGTVH